MVCRKCEKVMIRSVRLTCDEQHQICTNCVRELEQLELNQCPFCRNAIDLGASTELADTRANK